MTLIPAVRADVTESQRTLSALNLVKLCVGADTIEDLAEWQAHVSATRKAAGEDPRPRHVTRMWPRREAEIVGTEGARGSLYWVIRGLILVRQPILGFEEVREEDGIRRCAIMLDPGLMRTETRPRGPFQGWRYLETKDAPPDLGPWRGARAGGPQPLPVHLEAELSAMGVLQPAG
ncbi:MAG: DUF1489 domain-containing protein [Pseudomonadota bacterium]